MATAGAKTAGPTEKFAIDVLVICFEIWFVKTFARTLLATGRPSLSNGTHAMVDANAKIGRISSGLTIGATCTPSVRTSRWCLRSVPTTLLDVHEPVCGLQQFFAPIPARSRPPAGQQLLRVIDQLGSLAAIAQQCHFRYELVAPRQNIIDPVPRVLPPSGRCTRWGEYGHFACQQVRPPKRCKDTPALARPPTLSAGAVNDHVSKKCLRINSA
jgi:hypothetical protein